MKPRNQSDTGNQDAAILVAASNVTPGSTLSQSETCAQCLQTCLQIQGGAERKACLEHCRGKFGSGCVSPDTAE